MTTETINSWDLQDGDVQVSDGVYRTRVIRNPRLIGMEVHFHADGVPGFLTLQAEQDVTIAAREFEWLGNNDEDLIAWIDLHLVGRNASGIPVEFLQDGHVHLPGRDGDPVTASLATASKSRRAIRLAPHNS